MNNPVFLLAPMSKVGVVEAPKVIAYHHGNIVAAIDDERINESTIMGVTRWSSQEFLDRAARYPNAIAVDFSASENGRNWVSGLCGKAGVVHFRFDDVTVMPPSFGMERLPTEIGQLRAMLDSVLATVATAQPLLDDYAKGQVIRTEYPYSPRSRQWNKASPGGRQIRDLLVKNTDSYKKLLESFAPFRQSLSRIPVRGNPDETTPFWGNEFLPGFDGASIYGLLATRNPAVYLEIGSGNSTKFARQAIVDNNLRTRIVSIDPCPRANINEICDEVIRKPCEDVAPEFFSELGSDMLMFVDNSHRSFPNSDVTVFFTEILPALKSGVVWGLHDIFLPDDYPDSWKDRWYSEQYLLMAYLLGGGGTDTVLMPNAFLSADPDLRDLFRDSVFEEAASRNIRMSGGCFWMERG